MALLQRRRESNCKKATKCNDDSNPIQEAQGAFLPHVTAVYMHVDCGSNSCVRRFLCPIRLPSTRKRKTDQA